MEEGVLISEVDEPVKKFSSNERLTICMACPLFIRDTQVCNPYLWLNPETGDTSSRSRKGYIKGCGCLITRKMKQPNSHCHLGKG